MYFQTLNREKTMLNIFDSPERTYPIPSLLDLEANNTPIAFTRLESFEGDEFRVAKANNGEILFAENDILSVLGFSAKTMLYLPKRFGNYNSADIFDGEYAPFFMEEIIEERPTCLLPIKEALTLMTHAPMRSKAKKLAKWLVIDIIPSIEKCGYYVKGWNNLNEEDLIEVSKVEEERTLNAIMNDYKNVYSLAYLSSTNNVDLTYTPDHLTTQDLLQYMKSQDVNKRKNNIRLFLEFIKDFCNGGKKKFDIVEYMKRKPEHQSKYIRDFF